ncbi:MAG: response regulator [Pyrinomonadaceae bacterium]
MTKCKILLVEDNADDEMLCLRALKKNNITNEIIVARDGAEALDYLFAEDGGTTELPHLVLLDLKLPKINGLQVLARLRAHPRTELLPVVMLTTSIEEHDLVESYKLGVNSYIRKPVDFSEFTEVVRQLGLYWLLLNRNAPGGGSCADEYTASHSIR